MKNNLLYGLIAGLVAALVGSFLWAAITVGTGFQIGYMAIIVGCAVGFAVRLGGQGSTPAFAFMGAALALVGCALGNLWSAFGFFAKESGTSFVEILTHFDYTQSFTVLGDTFSPMDILFYGIAAWQGAKIATVDEFEESIKSTNAE